MQKKQTMALPFIHYDYPKERVAKYPLENKNDTRLLWQQGLEFYDKKVADLPKLLPKNAVIIYNNSHVMKAWLKIWLVKNSATTIPNNNNLNRQADASCHLIEPCDTGDSGDAILPPPTDDKHEYYCWWALVKPAKKLQLGQLINCSPEPTKPFVARILAKITNPSHELFPAVQLAFLDKKNFWQNLESFGGMPIPPYLKRQPNLRDDKAYQSIFAKTMGHNHAINHQTANHSITPEYSVASPTANLHFSPELRQTMQQQGFLFFPVTLHVGFGTFQPLNQLPSRLNQPTGQSNHQVKHKDKNQQIWQAIKNQNQLHREYGIVPADTAAAITKAKNQGRAIIAIGTTSLRILETAFRTAQASLTQPTLSQEKLAEPISAVQPYPVTEYHMKEYHGWTDIFIKPPDRIQSVDYLLTNFHYPSSSLLLLVNSFIGPIATKKLYQRALALNYRLFSYGDCCLLKNIAVKK